MNKEFVPYEQALALKELGFDEPCFMTYLNGKLDKEIFLFNHSIRSHSTQEFISAPLYQQAFRWFREKYDLDSFIKHIYKSTIKVGYYFGIDQYKGVAFQTDFDAWYKTYKEAELACLKKLIEIVKNK
jgi:hypothetical protein